MTKLLQTVFLFITLIFLSACATVDRGITDYVRIDSVPQGAKVTIMRDGDTLKSKPRICEATPCAISVPRRSTLIATIEKDGYQSAEILMFPSRLKGGAAGSAMANSSIMAGVGAYSGFAMAGFGNAFSFGLNPFSQSAAASSGAAVGLGFGVGMIAFDAAAGSNLNLYPNPFVLELAPIGAEIQSDPLTFLFKRKIDLDHNVERKCGKPSTTRQTAIQKSDCQTAVTERDKAKLKFNAALKTRKTAEKADLKERRKAFKSQSQN